MWRAMCPLALLPLRLSAEPARSDAAVMPLPVGAGGDVLGMLGSLLLLTALLLAGLWFLRRLRRAQRPQQGGVVMLSQIPVGMKEKLLVLQVGEERLLVGCTPAAMNTLHRWAAEELPGAADERSFRHMLTAVRRAPSEGEVAQCER